MESGANHNYGFHHIGIHRYLRQGLALATISMKKRKSPYIKAAHLFPHRLYLLMRNDLPSMNPGRGMAQAAHAANQFIHEFGSNPQVKHWQQSANGFGTTITVSADEMQVENIIAEAQKRGVIAGLVYDPTYSYSLHMEIAQHIDRKTYTGTPIFKDDGQVVLFRNELTCGYVFVSEGGSDREELVGALPLTP